MKGAALETSWAAGSHPESCAGLAGHRDRGRQWPGAGQGTDGESLPGDTEFSLPVVKTFWNCPEAGFGGHCK